jgi:hypothetical protein
MHYNQHGEANCMIKRKIAGAVSGQFVSKSPTSRAITTVHACTAPRVCRASASTTVRTWDAQSRERLSAVRKRTSSKYRAAFMELAKL